MRIVDGTYDDYMALMLDDGYVMNLNERGIFKAGDIHDGCTIHEIFIHPESECAWILVEDQYGNLFDVDIEYDGTSVYKECEDNDLPY